MSYGNAFKDQYLNQQVDVDGFPSAQRFQCYDLWARFVMDNYGLSKPIVVSPSGYAKDIWNNFDGLGLGNYFTKVAGAPQLGDWAIYGDAPSTPTSHVGMFLQDNGNGTIKLFQQNAPLPKATVGDLTKNGLLGYIRPKGGEEDMLNKERVNQIITAFHGVPANQTDYNQFVGKPYTVLLDYVTTSPTRVEFLKSIAQKSEPSSDSDAQAKLDQIKQFVDNIVK